MVSLLIDVVRSVFSVVLVVDDVDIVCLMSHLYKYIDGNPYPALSVHPTRQRDIEHKSHPKLQSG